MDQPIKPTPDDYIRMNAEFIKEDLPFRVTVPSQEQIDNVANRPEDYQQHQNLIVIPLQGELTEKEINLHFGSLYEKEIDEQLET